MSDGWIDLSNIDKPCPPVCRQTGPDIDIGYAAAAFGDFRPENFFWVRLEVNEFANIPWVKVLVEVGRAIYSEVNLGGEIDWHLRDSGYADMLEAALKPFEDVIYE